MRTFRIAGAKSLMTDAGFSTTMHAVRILLAQGSSPKVKDPSTGKMVMIQQVTPIKTEAGVSFDVAVND